MGLSFLAELLVQMGQVCIFSGPWFGLKYRGTGSGHLTGFRRAEGVFEASRASGSLLPFFVFSSGALACEKAECMAVR